MWVWLFLGVLTLAYLEHIADEEQDKYEICINAGGNWVANRDVDFFISQNGGLVLFSTDSYSCITQSVGVSPGGLGTMVNHN